MSITRPFSGRKNEKANSEFNQQNGLFENCIHMMQKWHRLIITPFLPTNAPKI
jgi:hypothetical protein